MILFLENNSFYLQCNYEERFIAKAIPGWKWDSKRKLWQYPRSLAVLEEVVKFDIVLDRGVKIWAKEVIQYLAKLEKIKKLDRVEISDFEFRIKPYGHQTVAFELLRKMPKFAIFLPFGTGKSHIAINANKWRLEKGLISRILIVCPKSLLENWQSEIRSNTGSEALIIKGPRGKRKKLLEQGKIWNVIG